MEAVHYFLDALVDKRVIGDVISPVFQLGFSRQFAIEQKIGNFQIRAFFGELIDGITTIFQYALVAVYKAYAALARRGIHKRRIVSHQTKLIFSHFDLAQVHRFDGVVFDRNLILLAGAIVGNR